MLEHLDNIIKDINIIKESSNYNLDNVDIHYLENKINDLKDNINLEFVKELANIIYQLNIDNTFSELTDHISNEFYAFEFLLEQNNKEK